MQTWIYSKTVILFKVAKSCCFSRFSSFITGRKMCKMSFTFNSWMTLKVSASCMLLLLLLTLTSHETADNVTNATNNFTIISTSDKVAQESSKTTPPYNIFESFFLILGFRQKSLSLYTFLRFMLTQFCCVRTKWF